MSDETPVPEAAWQMLHSIDKLPSLFADLALAQSEYLPLVRDRLVVQKLKDKQTGAYTGREIRFLYADLNAILAATRPGLSKHGLTFLQPLETSDDGTTWVVSILAHKDGGMIVSRMIVAPAKDMKEFGSNITYARRYAAGPILSVSAEDDADERDNERDDDQRGDDRQDNTEYQQPARAVPARKSASAPAKTAPAKTAAKPARAGEFALLGQVRYLRQQVKALKVTDAQLQAMLQRFKVNGLDDEAQIPLATWADMKAELEALRDA